MAKKKAAKKKTVTKRKPSTKPASAKKINKSAEIRDYAAQHPSAGPTEISEFLSAMFPKEKFTPQAVSVVLSNERKKTGKKAKGTRAGRAASTPAKTDGMVSLQALSKAKELIEAAGGADEAQQIIKALR